MHIKDEIPLFVIWLLGKITNLRGGLLPKKLIIFIYIFIMTNKWKFCYIPKLIFIPHFRTCNNGNIFLVHYNHRLPGVVPCFVLRFMDTCLVAPAREGCSPLHVICMLYVVVIVTNFVR